MTQNSIALNTINKKTALLAFILALILFSIFLSPNIYAAKDFIIENKTSSLFVVNGTTGNIILNQNFLVSD